MRKTVLIGSLTALLAGGGLWWLAKRPDGLFSQGKELPLFAAAPQGTGYLLTVNPPGPLRAITWMRPLPGGQILCLVSTQADQLMLGIYTQGVLQTQLPLPRPADAEPGFFRKATLRDASATGSLFLLLFGDEDHPKEQGWILALDRTSGELKWALPATGQRLALHGDHALIFGPNTPFGLLSWNKNKPVISPIDLPTEVKHPHSVVSLSGHAFIVAHQGGVSAYSEEGGWKHTPLPTESVLTFPAGHPVLVRTAQSLWWQPRPGQLVEIDSNAGIKREIALKELTAMAGYELDSQVLECVGVDPEGYLWFGLASPDLPKGDPVTSPTPPPEEGWTTEKAPTPAALPTFSEEERSAWDAYLKKPMDRVYRLSRDAKSLDGFTWSAVWPNLQPPAYLNPPRGDGAFTPEGSAFLLGEDLRRWYLPLKAVWKPVKK